MRRRFSVPRGLSAQRELRRLERTQVAMQRQAAIAARLHARQAMQDYVARRESETEEQIEDLHARVDLLRNVLPDVLSSNPAVDFEKLKETPKFPKFDPMGFDKTMEVPELDAYLPARLQLLQRILPPLVERHRRRIASRTSSMMSR